MAKEIEAMVECGKRFSASLDQYTSIKNRRFASVNVHSRANTTVLDWLALMDL